MAKTQNTVPNAAPVALTAQAMDPRSLIIIGLDTSDGPDHALYDERIKLKIDEAKLASVAEFGIVEPGLVWSDGAGRALVVDGRQRVRWAREQTERNLKAKKENPVVLVPMKLVEAPDLESLVALMNVANIREEDNALTKALKAARYMERTGASTEKAGPVFGVSAQQMRNYKAIAEADKSVQDAVARGALSLTAAVKVAKVGDKAAQKAAVSEATAGGSVTELNPKAKGEEGKAARKARKEASKKAASAAQKAKPKKFKPTEDQPFERPGMRLIRNLIETQDEIGGTFQDFCAWACGLKSPTSLKGLTTLIRKIEGGEE